MRIYYSTTSIGVSRLAGSLGEQIGGRNVELQLYISLLGNMSRMVEGDDVTDGDGDG